MPTVYYVQRKETITPPIEITFCQRCEQGLNQGVEGLGDYSVTKSRLLPTDNIISTYESSFPLSDDYQKEKGLTITRIIPTEAALRPCPRSPDGQHLPQISG